ncbi:U8 snoRNA-decapping enzyme-like [Ylistrum balloti]|uniref:U8 snoRNA-decapping enzyme-like n=1 Tax=Ylistrum balloti TaxID=509963 RepID=UPI002905F01B|nr:U8 snoRNA-decapping enzyme-like [Ylistrum balloti]
MSGSDWGNLAAFEKYGRMVDNMGDYSMISYNEAVSETYTTHKHASHTMLLARDPRVLWDLYQARAAILMQMRFDGVIGFPGGLVDPGENPVEAANREMVEEIGLDLKKHSITKDNHIVSYFNDKKSLVLHFFGLEVTLEEFCAIELQNLQAPDYGSETLGILRPPLYTMGDNYRGLPAFLSNSFAGNARDELLLGLEHFKTHTAEEIQVAVVAERQHAATHPNHAGLTNLDS